MKLPYNGGDNAPTRQLTIPRKTASTRKELHLVKSLAKGDS